MAAMNTPSLRTLVVDDDRPYRVLIKKSLVNHGHDVVICDSAEDAFRHLQNEQFDIVLLDYKMEGINGLNVLQWMFGKKMDVPVILVTSYGSEEIYEEAYKWGASAYFVKGEMDSLRLPVMVEQTYTKHQAQKNKISKV